MSRKLHDRLKPEISYLSYADLHREITQSEEDHNLKPNSNQQKQEAYRNASEEDEPVKYMSNLPGYLQREEKIRKKALNVGVLDWGRLEQWRYGHKHVPYRSTQSSASTSNTSSSVSTDGSSGNSVRGHDCYPSRQCLFCPSLQSHFVESPVLDQSTVVKSSGGGVGNCQNFGGSLGNGDTHVNYIRSDDHLSGYLTTNVLKVCKKKCLNPHIDGESGILLNDFVYEEAAGAKLKNNTQNGGTGKREENLRESNFYTVDQGALRESKPNVLLLPEDMPRNGHSEAPDMQTSSCRKLGSPSRTKYSEKNKKPSYNYLHRSVPYSCPLQDEVSRSHSQLKGSGSSSLDPESIKIPASTFSAPFPVKTGISPSKSRKPEERKQTIASTSSTNGPSKGVDQKLPMEKPRSTSPFRRLSISIGFTSKGSGCKDIAHVPLQSSSAALKYRSEHARGYARSNISVNDKPGDAAKSRISPLRRLLDPLLKPKAENCSHSMELPQKDSLLTNKKCRSGNGKFPTLLPEKELDSDHKAGCATTNNADSSRDKKSLASTVQALLRISVKNGQPLFTFAVDNNSKILAATMKNLPVSREDKCNCVYTFFTFREVKKKNGIWMNQAGKSRGPDYMHHVVAQMKVSDSHYYDSTSQNCTDSSTRKEFVLFSVKPRQDNAQVTDYQPNDELAAIVVKSPKAINLMNCEHQDSCQNDGQDLVTAVLPSGVHSLPSNGGPSSLIERWKTGGSCDCGGWDLGCKLKILANEKQACRKLRTSKAYFADQIELFLQRNEQDQENRPAFRFSPFKPGLYSVAFDSALSLLQAFSICIALINGKISYELCGSRNSVGAKNMRETMLDDLPASYVAYPPVSPVSRV